MYLQEGTVSQEQITFSASAGKQLIALLCALDSYSDCKESSITLPTTTQQQHNHLVQQSERDNCYFNIPKGGSNDLLIN